MDIIYNPISRGIQKITDTISEGIKKVYESIGGSLGGVYRVLGGRVDAYYFYELPTEVANDKMAQKIVEEAKKLPDFKDNTYNAISKAYDSLYVDARETKGNDYRALNHLRTRGGAHAIYLGVVGGMYEKALESKPEKTKEEKDAKSHLSPAIGQYSSPVAEKA